MGTTKFSSLVIHGKSSKGSLKFPSISCHFCSFPSGLSLFKLLTQVTVLVAKTTLNSLKHWFKLLPHEGFPTGQRSVNSLRSRFKILFDKSNLNGKTNKYEVLDYSSLTEMLHGNEGHDGGGD